MKSVTIQVPEGHLQVARVELEKRASEAMTDEQVAASLFYTGFNTLFETKAPIIAGPSEERKDS